MRFNIVLSFMQMDAYTKESCMSRIRPGRMDVISPVSAPMKQLEHTPVDKSELNIYFFSSPELKAQVSFSDRLSSVVCLSVRPSVNFSYFQLLLKNHWDNLNQT